MRFGSRFALRLGLAMVAVAVPTLSAQAQYTTILLPTYNADIHSLSAEFPTGNVTLGGVPFYIPTSTSNFLAFDVLDNEGYDPLTVNIPVNVYGVTSVDTLMNTYWGQSGPDSYLSVEFIGSGGADQVVNLVGNSDIRDFNNSLWTDSINGTTTTEVVSASGGAQRLDEQHFTLDSAFADQSLQTIRIVDTGGYSFQRDNVFGVTVLAETPEPGSIALLVTGGLTGAAFLRRRKRVSKKV